MKIIAEFYVYEFDLLTADKNPPFFFFSFEIEDNDGRKDLPLFGSKF